MVNFHSSKSGNFGPLQKFEVRFQMFEFGFNFIGKCSKGSKFDPLMFVQFEVRFFDVRSKTNVVSISSKC